MITLHHLRIGRSLFTAWLLEELEADYALKVYHRDPATMRAANDLKQIHPLGKSPVIEDDGLVISESGAITAYLLEKLDTAQSLSPPRSDLQAWARYTQWLHYPEGSVFTPLLMKMLLMRSGQPHAAIEAFSSKEITLHLEHISRQLGENVFILGERFSGADIGISYVISMAKRLGQLDGYPSLASYLERNMARPAFKKAVARAVE